MKTFIALLAVSAFILPVQANASQGDCTKPSCVKAQGTQKVAQSGHKAKTKSAQANASQRGKETREEMIVYPALFEAQSRF